MTIQECHKKMGADYQEVLERLYNEAMICKFVRMFLQDDSFQILEEALRRGDVKGRLPESGLLQPIRAHLYPDRDPACRTAGGYTGAVCKGGRAVQAHGGRYPRAGLKDNAVSGGFWAVRHCSFIGCG